MMTMTDTGVLEAAVMKGGVQEADPSTTTIADLIVLESKCCTWLDLCCRIKGEERSCCLSDTSKYSVSFVITCMEVFYALHAPSGQTLSTVVCAIEKKKKVHLKKPLNRCVCNCKSICHCLLFLMYLFSSRPAGRRRRSRSRSDNDR